MKDRRAVTVLMTRSQAETEALGETLAKQFRPGEVVGLYGDLGSGKTCWVRGAARGLGSQDPVSSPTFTLINEYHGRCPLYHFDLYRLNTPGELEDLGLEDYLYAEGICVLEWAEKAGKLLPRKHWRIEFQIQTESHRRITVYPPEEQEGSGQ